MADANTTDHGGAAAPEMSIDRMADLPDREQSALRELRDAVYPPEEEAGWSGAAMEWAPAQWRVAVRSPDGTLACHVGMLFRSGRHDGKAVRIAGIGGVKTHPRYRRRGYAEAAMLRAEKYFHERGDVDFGLLVCDPPLLPYYSRLGWQEFEGRLLVTQFGEEVEYTYSRVMTRSVLCATPTEGVIDLGGPPW
ncbi:GNAT family N-acetyltransferase [Streptomyces sp. CC224B]|uniref:GNAT family N-acetyltransferase n=1 Tax=Streptomyces sp. CC224B TaxID=3044571 RepID=UPI0024A95DAF|nr:GNAT family N-acetyltransferase [Streptomyces sp. CC224B]